MGAPARAFVIDDQILKRIRRRVSQNCVDTVLGRQSTIDCCEFDLV